LLIVGDPGIRHLNGFIDVDNQYAKLDGKLPPVIILKTQVIFSTP
jgi:hypothetical protein